jgi:tetratricopeptide (TPR) repeat protein
LEGILFGLGAKILEDVVADGLKERLHQLIENWRPGQNHDLEHAAADSLRRAAKALASAPFERPSKPVWEQLEHEAHGLFAGDSHSFPTGVMDALMVGDREALSAELAPIVGRYLGEDRESDAVTMASRLSSALLYEFGEALKKKEHAKAFNAFLREMARKTHQSVMEESAEVRSQLAKVLERLECIANGNLEPDASSEFQRLGESILVEIGLSRQLAHEDAERGIGATRDAETHIIQNLDSGFSTIRQILAPEPARDAIPVSSSNIPEGNGIFVGREALITQIQEVLRRDSMVILTGAHGLGKSECAIQFAGARKREYAHRAIVDGSSRSRLQSGYAELAGRLNLPYSGWADKGAIAGAVRQWLSEDAGSALLVVENVSDFSALQDLLPYGGSCRILMTRLPSRSDAVGSSIEVPALGEAAGSAVYLWRAKKIRSSHLEAASPADRLAAAKISELLGGVPLALQTAGAICDASSYSPEAFAAKLEEDIRTYSATLGKKYEPHRDSIDVLALSFVQLLEATSPACFEILRVLAMLSPEDVPEELFTAGAATLGGKIEEICGDRSALDRALQYGSTLNLFERTPAHGFKVHPCVQETVRCGASSQERSELARRISEALLYALPIPDVDTWSTCERLLPCVEECMHWMEAHRQESEACSKLLNRVAWYLQQRMLYPESRTLFERALAMAEKCSGSDSTDAAIMRGNLGFLLHEAGLLEEAYDTYRKALVQREKAFSATDATSATIRNRLGVILHGKQDFEAALGEYRHCLTCCEAPDGDKDLEVQVVANIAQLYFDWEKLDQAIQWEERTLELRRRCLPQRVGESLHRLGVLNYKLGQGERSESYFQESVEVRKQTLGVHADTAESQNWLGVLLYERGAFERALPLFEEAYATWSATLGPNHPKTRTALDNASNSRNAMTAV